MQYITTHHVLMSVFQQEHKSHSGIAFIRFYIHILTLMVQKTETNKVKLYLGSDLTNPLISLSLRFET